MDRRRESRFHAINSLVSQALVVLSKQPEPRLVSIPGPSDLPLHGPDDSPSLRRALARWTSGQRGKGVQISEGVQMSGVTCADPSSQYGVTRAPPSGKAPWITPLTIVGGVVLIVGLVKRGRGPLDASDLPPTRPDLTHPAK